MEKLTTMDIYDLCNENQWFTCGTNRQYEKMFDFVREAEIKSLTDNSDDIKKLATMIWICSDDNLTEEEIFKAIRKNLADKNGLYL